MSIGDQLTSFLTREDRGTATILVLYPNYTTKRYDERPTNITVVYSKTPVVCKQIIEM